MSGWRSAPFGCATLLGLVLIMLGGCSSGDSDPKEQTLIPEGAIGKTVIGSTSAEIVLHGEEDQIVQLAIDVGAVYLQPGALSSPATARIREILSLPDLPTGFSPIRAVDVDLGGGTLNGTMVVSVRGEPDDVMLHQVEGSWKRVGTIAQDGKLYTVVLSASPFVIADEIATTAATPGDKAGCFVAGFTGWSPGLNPLSPDFNTPDNLETTSQRSAIIEGSGITRALSAFEDTGVSVEGEVWRHYEWAEAYETILAAAERGYTIVLIGHSAGGAAILKLARALDRADVGVALLVGLDVYTGKLRPNALIEVNPTRVLFPWVTHDNAPVPRNVAEGINYYQQVTGYFHGEPLDWPNDSSNYLDREVSDQHPHVDRYANSPDVVGRLGQICSSGDLAVSCELRAIRVTPNINANQNSHLPQTASANFLMGSYCDGDYESIDTIRLDPSTLKVSVHPSGTPYIAKVTNDNVISVRPDPQWPLGQVTVTILPGTTTVDQSRSVTQPIVLNFEATPDLTESKLSCDGLAEDLCVFGAEIEQLVASGDIDGIMMQFDMTEVTCSGGHPTNCIGQPTGTKLTGYLIGTPDPQLINEERLRELLQIGQIADTEEDGAGPARYRTYSYRTLDSTTVVFVHSWLRFDDSGLPTRDVFYFTVERTNAGWRISAAERGTGAPRGLPGVTDLGSQQSWYQPWNPTHGTAVIASSRFWYGMSLTPDADDSCLNVRSSPSISGRVLDCIGSAPLVTLVGGPGESDGRTWLKIRTYDGLVGWAAEEFLIPF